jgi:vacuolar-type H+-ATPase subunit I/STV1
MSFQLELVGITISRVLDVLTLKLWRKTEESDGEYVHTETKLATYDKAFIGCVQSKNPAYMVEWIKECFPDLQHKRISINYAEGLISGCFKETTRAVPHRYIRAIEKKEATKRTRALIKAEQKIENKKGYTSVDQVKQIVENSKNKKDNSREEEEEMSKKEVNVEETTEAKVHTDQVLYKRITMLERKEVFLKEGISSQREELEKVLQELEKAYATRDYLEGLVK